VVVDPIVLTDAVDRASVGRFCFEIDRILEVSFTYPRENVFR
jgi:hypothetical protein